MQQDMPNITPQHTMPDVDEGQDVAPGPVILLCGAGQLAHEVATLASQAHFAVDVADIDAEKANAELFPMARACFVVPDFANLAELCDIGPEHYIAILTPQTQHSQQILEQVLHTPARYIGLAGKRDQRAPLFAALREQGIPNTELACVRCPIGLPIGAQGPEESAIAIIAECIAAREGCLPRAAKDS